MSKGKLLTIGILWSAVLFFSACDTGGVQLERDERTEATESVDEETEESQRDLIWVYVCGQVAAPGVYEMRRGDRWYQAVELAGGALAEADLSRINLAAPIEDGEKLYIPVVGEAADLQEESESDRRININRASREELMTLPGIGEAKADAIIAYREGKGRFDQEEDLMEVPGIKEGVYEKIKERIRID